VSLGIDHIVYGVPDLDAGVDDLERRLGVRAGAGGRHVGGGTHNALLGLGGATYLEVIALDPDRQPGAASAFGLDTLTAPKLVGWAARADALDDVVAHSRAAGFDPGDIAPLGRTRPDGVRLDWRLTRAPDGHPGFIVPFLIDWMQAQHPSETSPAGVELRGFHVVHPDPDRIRAALAALTVDVPVERGDAPGLVAELEGPAGRGTLA
jgi:hypothetical protein